MWRPSKHRWRDGTSHVVFEPAELVERLAALVPPPRVHLVRYHGIPISSEWLRSSNNPIFSEHPQVSAIY